MIVRNQVLVLLGMLVAFAPAIAQAEPTTAPAAPPKVGEAAREFSLTDIEGKAIALNDLTKEGPFVLVVLRGYPGYQCPLCTRQVAELRGKAEEIRQRGGRVLFVYPGPKERLEERAREFLESEKLPGGFTFATDPDYGFVNGWGLRWDAKNETAYPSTFVIGKDGIVRFAKISKTHGDRAKTADVIEALAQEK